MKSRYFFAAAALFILCIEIIIGCFIHDRLIRPYLGDVLVIILLCCIVRIVSPKRPIHLGLYMISVGVAAELLQLVHLDQLLGVRGTVLGTLLGSTCDIRDILCYTVGGVLFELAERRRHHRKAG